MSLVVFQNLVYSPTLGFNRHNLDLMGISVDADEVFIRKIQVEPQFVSSFDATTTGFQLQTSHSGMGTDKVVVHKTHSQPLTLNVGDCVVFFNEGIPTLFTIERFEPKKIIGRNLTTNKKMIITNEHIDALETMQVKKCDILDKQDDETNKILLGHTRKVNKTPRRNLMTMFTRRSSPKRYSPSIIRNGNSYDENPEPTSSYMSFAKSQKRRPWYKRWFNKGGTRKRSLKRPI